MRIQRQSQAECPSDDSKKLGFVIDVLCNEKANIIPANMEMVTFGSADDNIGDKCIYHVQLEHMAGCSAFNFLPFKRVFGLAFIFSGILLTYLGKHSLKNFMEFIV